MKSDNISISEMVQEHSKKRKRNRLSDANDGSTVQDSKRQTM